MEVVSEMAPQAPALSPHQDYLILAGALQDLFRKCPPIAAERQFTAAWSAHRALRVQLRQKVPLRLPAQVLNDLSHEVAPHVGAYVRQAALRRLRHECAARSSMAGGERTRF
ncbi:MAG TPA: hypothetical protein VNB23_09290 [Ramlibacter sp.]|nr:hypothetical protein [Ramlibacter sp.]